MPEKLIYIAIDEINTNAENDAFLPSLKAERSSLVNILRNRRANEDGIEVLGETRDSWKDIIRDINAKENDLAIFHFAGHANGAELHLADVNVDGSNVAFLLKNAPQLKLVFLNGCSTQGQIEHFLTFPQKIAIIATYRPISDSKAKAFSERFYGFLMEGITLKTAFDRAILGDNPQKNPEDFLFRSLGTDDAQKFKNNDFWGFFCESDATHNWKLLEKTVSVVAPKPNTDSLIRSYWYNCDRGRTVAQIKGNLLIEKNKKIHHFFISGNDKQLSDMIPTRVLLERRTDGAIQTEQDRRLPSFTPESGSFEYDDNPEIQYQLFLDSFSTYFKINNIINLLKSPYFYQRDYVIIDIDFDDSNWSSSINENIILRFMNDFSQDKIQEIDAAAIQKILFFWRIELKDEGKLNTISIPNSLKLENVEQAEIHNWLKRTIASVYDDKDDRDLIEENYYKSYEQPSYDMRNVREVFEIQIKPKLVDYLNQKTIN